MRAIIVLHHRVEYRTLAVDAQPLIRYLVNMITSTDMRLRLVREVEKAGSQKAWAAEHGLSGAYICDVLKGRRGISSLLAAELGFNRIITFNRIDDRKNQ